MFCDSFASYVWESECVKCFLRDCACCPYKAEAWLYRYSAACRSQCTFYICWRVFVFRRGAWRIWPRQSI